MGLIKKRRVWDKSNRIKKINPLNPESRRFRTHLTPADDFLGVYPRPKLLSLSLNESGVEADNEDRDGRDMAMDLEERSRTWHLNHFYVRATEARIRWNGRCTSGEKEAGEKFN